MTGVCPADGCLVELNEQDFACDPHWRMLPRFTQRRLLESFRVGFAEVGGKYRDWTWWSARAVREIDAALANRAHQLACAQAHVRIGASA